MTDKTPNILDLNFDAVSRDEWIGMIQRDFDRAGKQFEKTWSPTGDFLVDRVPLRVDEPNDAPIAGVDTVWVTMLEVRPDPDLSRLHPAAIAMTDRVLVDAPDNAFVSQLDSFFADLETPFDILVAPSVGKLENRSTTRPVRLLLPARNGAISDDLLSQLTPYVEDDTRSRVVTGTSKRDSSPVERLANVFTDVLGVLDRLTEGGLSPAQAFHSLIVEVSTGASYLVDLCWMRSLRAGLAQLAVDYGCDAVDAAGVEIWTRSFVETTTDDYTFAIRRTLSFASAVIGGADVLLVDTVAPNLDLAASHILRQESGIVGLPDPAAGSPLLEHTTAAILSAAWSQFHAGVMNNSITQ